MIELRLEDKICEVKTKANEVTIKQLSACESILEAQDISELDKYVGIIQELSNLTVEEIEDLPINVLKEVMTMVSSQDFSLEGLPFRNKVEINGVTYSNRCTSIENIKLSVKELFTIKSYYNLTGGIKANEIAGVLFREELDGVISRDFSNEAIEKRSLDLEEMTLDLILPFIINIQKHLQ